MKNIHILPTHKASRLFIHNAFNDIRLDTKNVLHDNNQNVYITSSEEIKKGDWFIQVNTSKRIKHHSKNGLLLQPQSFDQKIILTTDVDLDGVQAIDDEFLEWFVQNSSCEEVEVEKETLDISTLVSDYEKYPNLEVIGYKIIIPKEEPKQEYSNLNYGGGFTEEDIKRVSERKPKQETLEEIVEKLSIEDAKKLDMFLNGMKYQEKIKQEHYSLMEIELRHTKTLLASCEMALEERNRQTQQKYSEEEVIEILKDFRDNIPSDVYVVDWFEQYKK